MLPAPTYYSAQFGVIKRVERYFGTTVPPFEQTRSFYCLPRVTLVGLEQKKKKKKLYQTRVVQIREIITQVIYYYILATDFSLNYFINTLFDY